MTVHFDKRRQRWVYDFWDDGHRHQGYCRLADGAPARNRTEARQAQTEALVQARRAAQAGAPAGRGPVPMLLAEALTAHAGRYRGKSHFGNLRTYIRELLTWFGPDTPVGDLDELRIWDYVAWAREQPLLVYVGGPAVPAEQRLDPRHWRPEKSGRRRTDATINRYLDCLRAALSLAHRARDPVTRESRLPLPPKVPELDELQRIPRPIRDGNLQRIIATAPPHLAQAVVLTILMGLRKAEVFGLTVDQVDDEGGGLWLRAEETKGGRDEFIPASPPALALLRQLKTEAVASGVPWLITYTRGRDGEPRQVKNPKRAWARVMRDLGLSHRFHDTKASFSTGLAEQHLPAHLIQQLSRHKDMATTQRYIDLVDGLKRQGLNALGERAAVAGLDPAQGIGRAPSGRAKSLTEVPDKKRPSRRKAISA